MIRNLQYKYLENRKSSLFYFTIFTVKYFFWCYKSFIMVDKHYDRKIYSTTVRTLNFLKRSLFYFEIFNPFNTFNPFPFIISFLLFYTKCMSLIEKEKKVMRKGLLILFDVRDHPFKTSANFHDFWSVPPSRRSFSIRRQIWPTFDPSPWKMPTS